MDVIDQLFHKMETQDSLDYELFDLDGKNYCPVDGVITLKEFVDNDNALDFYKKVKSVAVIRKLVKDNGARAAVEFEIEFYDPAQPDIKGPSVVVIWVFGISKENKIDSIDSYWNAGEFKKLLSEKYPHFLPLFFRG